MPVQAPLRALHVVRPASGGIRQHVINLLTQTDPHSVTHALAAPPAFLQSLPAIGQVSQYPLAIAPSLAPWSDMRAALRLATLTRTSDIVHAHGLRAGWIAALACGLRRFPLVVTAHNIADNSGALARVGIVTIGHKASIIIAVSNAVAQSLSAQGVPAHKIRVIPNGVTVITVSEKGRRDAGNAEFTVGCIARLSPEKGVDILLHAASLMPQASFLIAGDGPLRETLASQCPPNVRLLGRIEDVPTFLETVDVLAVPSRMEGQGIVALEAMAQGVPVVASQVGGLAEMLTDRETALLVPAGEPAALAEALNTLQCNPALRAALSINGRELVQSHYALTGMLEAVTQVYLELRK